MPNHITLNEDTLMPTESGVGFLAGVAASEPRPIGDSDRFFVHTAPAGATRQVIDLEELAEKLADRPRRKRGTVHVHDAESFIGYISKHQLASTEVWADNARQGFVGVINAHEESDDHLVEGDAGHGDHRVVLELIHTPEWKKWTARDKEWLDQATFAEHIEDNAINVVTPDAATMLEIAESFQATRSADFKAGTRLSNGLVQIRYEETENATAGHSGDLEIPTTFTLALAPFVGAPPVEITARFRYRIRGGNLSLSYALLNPDEIARGVFTDVVDEVDHSITAPVFLGRPA